MQLTREQENARQDMIRGRLEGEGEETIELESGADSDI